MRDAAHLAVREHAFQCLHALPVPAVDDGEARRAWQRPGPGRGPQQMAGSAGDAGQVTMPGEVVGDDIDISAGQASVREQPLHGRGGVLAGVLDPGQAFLLRHAGQLPASDQGSGGIVSERAQPEHCRPAVTRSHRCASLSTWRSRSRRSYQRPSASASGPPWPRRNQPGCLPVSGLAGAVAGEHAGQLRPARARCRTSADHRGEQFIERLPRHGERRHQRAGHGRRGSCCAFGRSRSYRWRESTQSQ